MFIHAVILSACVQFSFSNSITLLQTGVITRDQILIIFFYILDTIYERAIYIALVSRNPLRRTQKPLLRNIHAVV